MTEEQKSSSSLDEDMDEDDTPSSRTTDSSMVVRKEGGSRAERTVAELDNLVSADKSDCLNDEDPEETRVSFSPYSASSPFQQLLESVTSRNQEESS